MAKRNNNVSQGYCAVCGVVQGVSPNGAIDLAGDHDENLLHLVDYHTDAGGNACDGFNKPPRSVIHPQGASSSPEDHDFESPSSEYLGADNEDFFDDEEMAGRYGC